MPISRRRPVNRTNQVEHLQYAVRPQVEILADEVDQAIVADPAGTESLHADRCRLCDADGVGHLDFAPIRQARCNDRAPMAQELQEARWLIRNVEQRFTTIQCVAEAIVAHQRTFFEYGEVALKPLVLREVAEELGLHESTVSRATGNKYMATPRGIFEFKHFFSRELSTETGGTCSTTAVRALIKELIAGEDTTAPLSDVTLTQMLAKQGVIVARRTVSKYRTLMKVPPAELRRQL